MHEQRRLKRANEQRYRREQNLAPKPKPNPAYEQAIALKFLENNPRQRQIEKDGSNGPTRKSRKEAIAIFVTKAGGRKQ